MGATDRVAAARAAFDAIIREQSDRRELRERHTAEARAKAQESMSRQGKEIQKYTEHLAELGRRQKEDPWQAHKEDQPEHLTLGGEQQLPEETPDVPQVAPAPQATGPTYSFGPSEEEAPPGAPPPRPAAGPRRTPRRPVTDDDDDDFSTQRWLR